MLMRIVGVPSVGVGELQGRTVADYEEFDKSDVLLERQAGLA
jgi:hypothetical protein